MSSRARLAALGLALGLAAASAAQPAGGPPDVPAGEAAIRGRVVHRQRPAQAAGVDVVLYALPSGGAPGVRRATSDAQGRFAFEGISGDPEIAYLVGARYAELPFPGARVRFAPGEREHEVEVPITDLTPHADAIEVEELRLQLDWRGATLDVAESFTLRNDGEQTFWVPVAERSRHRAALRAALPDGAQDFGVPLGVVPEGLEVEGDSLRYFGPVYPGAQQLEWSYALPSPAGELALVKPLPTPPRRVVVLAPAGGPELRSAELRPGPELVLGGRRFRSFEAEGFTAGDRLELALAVPPARTAPEAVSVAETRIVLELDAAALQVSEDHVLRVDGDTRVAAPPGASLVRILLPPEAQDLRFGENSAELGLAPDAEGGLAVMGPLAPGEARVEIAYRIPAGAGPLEFERRFAAAVPLLTVFVADDGRLALSSDRLHRRRPVRSADRVYAQLEAFEVAAGESVGLELAPLPPRQGLPRPLLLALFALAASAALAALLAPLWRSAPAQQAEEATESAAMREREALYAAMRDLEHDRETQKIDDADYAQLRGELRQRAAVLLSAERAPHAAPVPVPAPEATAEGKARACARCGSPASGDHRYCAFCGMPLDALSEGGGRA